jgi:hypothetical protein
MMVTPPRRLDPFAAPSGNVCYLRSPDGSNRRIALKNSA